MRVLVACEYSGIVRNAFRKKGHDAWSCDLKESESPGPHIQGDVLQYLDDGWDMLIGHPPCTFLARSGAFWLHRDPSRYDKMINAKDFFLKLANCKIKKKALEQPNPYSGAGLPQSTQRIEPFYFGDPVRKSIHLWLYDLPALMATVITEPKINYVNAHRSPHIRSRFFEGIAWAMATQWS